MRGDHRTWTVVAQFWTWLFIIFWLKIPITQLSDNVRMIITPSTYYNSLEQIIMHKRKTREHTVCLLKKNQICCWKSNHFYKTFLNDGHSLSLFLNFLNTDNALFQWANEDLLWPDFIKGYQHNVANLVEDWPIIFTADENIS